MATHHGPFVGIDVSKDRLDVGTLGERQVVQVDNTQTGIQELVTRMQELQPELIVVEATGGYQRAVVEALFWAGLPVAVVNPTRVRQFARAGWSSGQDRPAGCICTGRIWEKDAAQALREQE